MNNFMNSVKLTRPTRNRFDMSHDRKFSFRMGELVPCLAKEAVPNGSYRGDSTQVVRLSPLAVPMMHRVDVRTEYFGVPKRLIWDGWEGFITGQDAFEQPYMMVTGIEAGSLMDYLGYPVGDYTGNDLKVLVYAIYAYYFIYNEYYRDQNLNAIYPQLASNGDNTGVLAPFAPWKRGSCLRSAWEKDLFTSSLPFRQKGNPVTIPVLGNAPISFINPTTASLAKPVTGGIATAGDLSLDGVDNTIRDGALIDVAIDNSANLEARLDLAAATTINDLRLAYRVQEWLERNALGGTRYTEWLRAHFGVTPQDSRLQRPEYLGGGVSPVSISEVLQTSETSDDSPLGGYAGHGINVGKSRTYSLNAVEHMEIIGIIRVLPRTAYFQGVPKRYIKWDKFDYLDAIFAHLGEQPIQLQEVVAFKNDRETAFGYQRMYYDYCTALSSVHGEFTTTQKSWHMARWWDPLEATPVQLNADFISADPTDRVFAYVGGDVDNLYAHMYHDCEDIIPLPKYGTPSGG